MENFIKAIREQRDRDNSNGTEQLGPIEEVSYFLQLAKFKKEVETRFGWIEEFMLDGEFEVPKRHLVNLGNELFKLYEKLEELEKKDKEDCGCNDKKEE